MKARHFIGNIVIIILSLYLVAVGMAGYQSQMDTKNLIIEKAVPSKAIQHSVKSDDQFEPNRSIFSTTTMISLVVAVIGIVAFRRNTYS
jgi:hypothetical protein